MTHRSVRWQPVLLVINQRLECQCGALAVIVTGHIAQQPYNVMTSVDVWCQSCFEKTTQENEDKEEGQEEYG